MSWQSMMEQIEHEISICVCSVLLTRKQSGRFVQLAIEALGKWDAWQLGCSAIERLAIELFGS
jgi:hypothetical protein